MFPLYNVHANLDSPPTNKTNDVHLKSVNFSLTTAHMQYNIFISNKQHP